MMMMPPMLLFTDAAADAIAARCRLSFATMPRLRFAAVAQTPRRLRYCLMFSRDKRQSATYRPCR